MSHVLRIEEACLRRGGNTILDGISWTIHAGEHWALIGANGSGKTVTLRMVLGHLWPTSGSIEVLGHRFGAYDLRKLREENRLGKFRYSVSVHEARGKWT